MGAGVLAYGTGYRQGVTDLRNDAAVHSPSAFSDWLHLCASSDADLVAHERDQILSEALDLHDSGTALLKTWMTAEWPERALGSTEWVRLFRETGFVALPALDRPSRALRLFRGSSAANWRGMAWTADLAVARLFAERWIQSGVEAHVYVATVEPAGVLARLGAGGEDEVIVDPGYLPDNPDQVLELRPA